jgi:hypothetical protein
MNEFKFNKTHVRVPKKKFYKSILTSSENSVTLPFKPKFGNKITISTIEKLFKYFFKKSFKNRMRLRFYC